MFKSVPEKSEQIFLFCPRACVLKIPLCSPNITFINRHSHIFWTYPRRIFIAFVVEKSITMPRYFITVANRVPSRHSVGVFIITIAIQYYFTVISCVLLSAECDGVFFFCFSGYNRVGYTIINSLIILFFATANIYVPPPPPLLVCAVEITIIITKIIKREKKNPGAARIIPIF